MIQEEITIKLPITIRLSNQVAVTITLMTEVKRTQEAALNLAR